MRVWPLRGSPRHWLASKLSLQSVGHANASPVDGRRARAEESRDFWQRSAEHAVHRCVSESVSTLGLIDQSLLHQGQPEIDENARFVRKVSVGPSQKNISSLWITGCKAIESLAVALNGISRLATNHLLEQLHLLFQSFGGHTRLPECVCEHIGQAFWRFSVFCSK